MPEQSERPDSRQTFNGLSRWCIGRPLADGDRTTLLLASNSYAQLAGQIPFCTCLSSYAVIGWWFPLNTTTSAVCIAAAMVLYRRITRRPSRSLGRAVGLYNVEPITALISMSTCRRGVAGSWFRPPCWDGFRMPDQIARVWPEPLNKGCPCIVDSALVIVTNSPVWWAEDQMETRCQCVAMPPRIFVPQHRLDARSSSDGFGFFFGTAIASLPSL